MPTGTGAPGWDPPPPPHPPFPPYFFPGVSAPHLPVPLWPTSAPLLPPPPGSCLVKVTGELTMSFPAGIVRVFSGGMAPPVLSFRLLNTGAIEQFLPNAELLYRCGDAGTRWHRGTGMGMDFGGGRAHGVRCWGGGAGVLGALGAQQAAWRGVNVVIWIWFWGTGGVPGSSGGPGYPQ